MAKPEGLNYLYDGTFGDHFKKIIIYVHMYMYVANVLFAITTQGREIFTSLVGIEL